MENQHRKITGYRELTEQEILMMNGVKHLGKKLDVMISQLEEYRTAQLCGDSEIDLTDSQLLESGRCIDIAKAELQTGFMWLTRAIALPDSF